MNPVLDEIEKSGKMILQTGETIKVQSHIGSGSIDVIRRAIEKVRPQLGCEVGLAYGISTLYILEAMQENGGGRLIGMDPAQHDNTWRGGGLNNIKRAGFTDQYDFHEDTSQRVLPELATAGTRIQFGFIDGWHTFDHTLVDFFFIDQMLDVGGLVILDDVGYPGLRRLVHFIVANRDYEILDYDPITMTSSWKSRAKRMLRKILNPVVRDNYTPDAKVIALEDEVDKAQLIALRKLSDDVRSFDHFVAF